jgi:NAD(P)-dependent dehydrogenase (short-subunit alcohol dehydrogenase family)
MADEHPRLRRAVEGKVVMVTGASSGIGKATALLLAGAGAEVLLVARTEDKLDAVHKRIATAGGIAHVHRADVADIADVERMAADVLERHHHVDILVNNAGHSIRRSIALSYDRFHDYERSMAVNYFGPVRLILALLPAMRKQRSGHIINVSTIGVQTGPPRYSAYVASKAALDAFSRSAAAELSTYGIRITTIHMPLVQTPMIRPTRIYNVLPKISARQAAGMIAKAVVTKPRRIDTALGSAGELAYAVNPRLMDVALGVTSRLFRDSAAARGRKPKAD